MKLKFCTLFAWLAVTLSSAQVQASAIRLETVAGSPVAGSTFQVRIVADVDPADAIIGFGFDVNSLSGLRFRGFSAGPGFGDDPVYLAPFSDSDGIRGASAGSLLSGPPVSGLNLLLGLLEFEALTAGTASFALGADDLAFNFTEGLIPFDPDLVNFLPTIAPYSIEVTPGVGGVPEPSSLLCVVLALGLLARSASRRRTASASPSPACA
jgi:hypothetical protein